VSNTRKSELGGREWITREDIEEILRGPHYCRATLVQEDGTERVLERVETDFVPAWFETEGRWWVGESFGLGPPEWRWVRARPATPEEIEAGGPIDEEPEEP
jgi:hypothetical protein